MKKSRFFGFIFGVLLLVMLIPSVVAQDGDTDTDTTSDPTTNPAPVVVQQPDMNVVTEPEDRVSWGAVFAGAILALIIQLGLNLLGISLGALSINPEYDDASASPKSLGMGAILWVMGSALIALFIGGWVAGRFADIPDQTDGALHGLLVWGLVSLVSMFFLATSIGSILSGVSTLVGQALNLAGKSVQMVADAAGSVAGAGASLAGSALSAAGSAAGFAGNAAADAAGGAANLAQNAASRVSPAAQNFASAYGIPTSLDDIPELRDAMERLDLSFEAIKEEASNLINQAQPSGAVQGRVQEQVDAASDDLRAAASYATQHPGQADRALTLVLRRILRRGQSVVTDEDRQQAIDYFTRETGITPERANSLLEQWHSTYQAAQQEVESARESATQQLHELQESARKQAEAVQKEVMQRATDARKAAEREAREAGQAFTKAIAALSAAVFAALVIGAAAAGIGGVVGSPDEAQTTVIPVSQGNE